MYKMDDDYLVQGSVFIVHDSLFYQLQLFMDRGDRSASCAPNAVNHSFNIVDFCRDSTKFKRT